MPFPVNRKPHDSQQPRVPKGYTGGGRWTDGDDHGEASKRSEEPSREADTADSEPFIDRAAGAVVRSEYATPDHEGWSERHTVTLRDGSAYVFEDWGRIQRVYRNGEPVGTIEWTENGPVQHPLLQNVYARRPQPGRVGILAAALSLWRALNAARHWSEGGKFAALTFDARALRAGDEKGALPAAKALTEEEIRNYCKKVDTVQRLLDAAANDVNALNRPMTPQQYGTKVHVGTARGVSGDSNLRAEPSLRKILQADPSMTEAQAEKSMEAPYGERGTIRIDVLENVDGRSKLICVYDIKTGDTRLTEARIREIARIVALRYPGSDRIIIIESRPRILRRLK